MYCTKCGAQIADGVKFCGQCGAAAPGANTAGTVHGKLVRPRTGRTIAGVCAAFANAYGWDVIVVRIATVLLAFCGCGGFLAYLIAWACIPNEDEA